MTERYFDEDRLQKYVILADREEVHSAVEKLVLFFYFKIKKGNKINNWRKWLNWDFFRKCNSNELDIIELILRFSDKYKISLLDIDPKKDIKKQLQDRIISVIDRMNLDRDTRVQRCGRQIVDMLAGVLNADTVLSGSIDLFMENFKTSSLSMAIVENGKIIAINKSYLDELGMREEEVLGQNSCILDNEEYPYCTVGFRGGKKLIINDYEKLRVIETLQMAMFLKQDTMDSLEEVILGSTLKTTVRNFWEKFKDMIPYDRISVMILDSDVKEHIGDEVKMLGHIRELITENGVLGRLAKGFSAEIPINSRIANLFKTGKISIIGDLEKYYEQQVTKSPITRSLIDEGHRSSITIPLMIGNKVFGFLFLNSQKVNAYDKNHRGLMSSLQKTLGSIFKTIIEKEDFIPIDAKSGLYNSVGFEHQAIRRLTLMRRKYIDNIQSKSIMACIDMDRFKCINDRFGHGVGDYVIGCVGKILKDNLRDGDFAARLGGDEYVIMLNDINDIEIGIKIIRRIQEKIGEIKIGDIMLKDIEAEDRNGEIGRIGMSCGLVCISNGVSVSTLGSSDVSLEEVTRSPINRSRLRLDKYSKVLLELIFKRVLKLTDSIACISKKIRKGNIAILNLCYDITRSGGFNSVLVKDGEIVNVTLDRLSNKGLERWELNFNQISHLIDHPYKNEYLTTL